MTKQYFSTLFKRVSIISLIGIAIMILVLACSAPNGGGGGGDSIGMLPKSSPKLLSVAATVGGDGGYRD